MLSLGHSVIYTHSGSTYARDQLFRCFRSPFLLAGISPKAALQHQLGALSPQKTSRLLLPTAKTNDDVESGPSFLHLLSKEVAGWRMMPEPYSSILSTPTGHAKFSFTSNDTANTVFTFRRASQPNMALTFPPPASPPRVKKRGRSVSDVDGEHSCIHKKKRRLRLFLITSRLSPQFSHPATNIVDRGISKIAVWAKQKAIGRNLLCKAAILNRIRRRSFDVAETEGGMGKALVEQEKGKEHLRLAAMTLKYGSHDSFTRPGRPIPPSLDSDANATERLSLSRSSSRSSSGSPSPPLRPRDHASNPEYRSPNDAYFDTSQRSRAPGRSYLPLPPSPLGLSLYDAFDQEEDIPDPYAHLDDEYEAVEPENHDEVATGPFAPESFSHPRIISGAHSAGATSPTHSIYSDFSILDPDEPVFGDYDQVDEGVDTIWPSTFASERRESTTIPLPPSPGSPTLFAVSQTPSTTLSPSLTALSTTAISPNFSSLPLRPTLSPTPVSPIIPPHLAISGEARTVADEAAVRAQGPDLLAHQSNSELEEERARQKRLMFMQFGS